MPRSDVFVAFDGLVLDDNERRLYAFERLPGFNGLARLLLALDGLGDQGLDLEHEARIAGKVRGRELGGKAIEAAAKKVESEAGKRGLDVSKITQAAASKAHEHLHDAEGFVQKKMNEGQASLEKKAGVSGTGHGRMHGRGHGRMHGGDMYESGSGGGMYQMKGSGDAYAPPAFIHAPTSYPVPRSAMPVSSTHHLMSGY